MPCQQITDTSATHNPPLSTRSGPFTSQADCLEACKEGACCNGTTCTVKPQCQCNGTGDVFKGIGTTCSPNPCCPSLGLWFPAGEDLYTISSFGTNARTIAMPPEAGIFYFFATSAYGSTGAGACNAQIDTYTIRAGGGVVFGPRQVLTGQVGEKYAVCKPADVTSIEVEVFIPTQSWCVGEVSTTALSKFAVGCFAPGECNPLP